MGKIIQALDVLEKPLEVHAHLMLFPNLLLLALFVLIYLSVFSVLCNFLFYPFLFTVLKLVILGVWFWSLHANVWGNEPSVFALEERALVPTDSAESLVSERGTDVAVKSGCPV